MTNTPQRIYTFSYKVMLWFALITQFIISTKSYMAQGRSFVGSLIQIISFFTIQTNLLIAVSLTVVMSAPGSRWGRFFGRASTQTAIAVYILIVGLVYALVLKGIWQLNGWFKLTDVLMHEVSPIAYLLFWIFFVPKEKLEWKLMFPWALFPLLYLFYSLIRGAIVGDYPYPFLNAAKLGYAQVAINSVGVLLVFLVFSGALIGISRALSGRANE